MKTRRANPSPPSGIALMIVMLALFALTVIIAGFAYSMKVEMRLAQITDYDDQLQWMGRSGIELARFALANKCADQRNIDALDQFWAGGAAPCSNDVPNISLKDFQIGGGKISVTITDMERKWDINLVANPQSPQMDVLQKALNMAGVTDPSQSSTIIDSILDWVNSNPDPHFSGAKDDYYMGLPTPYHCKDGPIDDLSELLLIKGITPEIYWGENSSNHPVAAYQERGPGGFDHTPGSTKSRFANEADKVSNPVGLHELFSAMGARLNINTASATTLQLLPGIDAATAERIIQQRAGPDGIDGTDDDVPFQNVGEMNSGLPGGAIQLPAAGAAGGGVAGAPAAGVAAGGLATYCDVRSYVFEVRVEAEINGYKRSFVGIISRSGASAAAIRCTKFYWE